MCYKLQHVRFGSICIEYYLYTVLFRSALCFWLLVDLRFSAEYAYFTTLNILYTSLASIYLLYNCSWVPAN